MEDINYIFLEIPYITTYNGSIISKKITDNLLAGTIIGCLIISKTNEYNKSIELRNKYLLRLNELDEYIKKNDEKKKNIKEKKIIEYQKKILEENIKFNKEKNIYDETYNKLSEILTNIKLYIDKLILDVGKEGDKNKRKLITNEIKEKWNEYKQNEKNIKKLKHEFYKKEIQFEKIRDLKNYIENCPITFEELNIEEECERFENEKNMIITNINRSSVDKNIDILFFEVIETFADTIYCKVSEHLFRNTDSNLKINDKIHIKKKYIAYTINDNFIEKKFNIKVYQNINKNITNKQGQLFTNPDKVLGLVEKDMIVGVTFKNEDNICSKYFKILGLIDNIFYGVFLDIYCYEFYNDYLECFTINKIYKFNKESIIKIPDFPDIQKHDNIKKIMNYIKDDEFYNSNIELHEDNIFIEI